MTSINTPIDKTGKKSSTVYRANVSNNTNPINVSPVLKEKFSDNNLSSLKLQLIQEKKKNGLIERFYDFCKNKSGLGICSKKVEQKIAKFEKGEVTEAEAKNKLSDYKISQENAAQNFGDLASGLVGISGYFGLSNLAKKYKARFEINSLKPNIKILLKHLEHSVNGAKFNKDEIKKFLNSSAKTKAAIIPLVMLAGGITKWALLKINRIGSKEFKVEDKDKLNKKEFKKAKKRLNLKRHKLNFKNFFTGAVNGLLAPLTAVAGGIMGVPAYILATSGIRFLTSKNDKKDKSFNNFSRNLQNNIVADSLFAAILAIPAFKKARYSEVLGKNLEKVVNKLKDVKLQEPDLPSSKTAFDELADIMLHSKKIENIILSYKNFIRKTKNIETTSKLNETIRKLTDANIFAVKFLQISGRGDSISSALIENCPPSRSIGEAQPEINKLLKSDKYKVSKLLGVGTVAESYLAKDTSGKEVCIKILKKGITAEKIQRDKQAFIKLVTKNKSRLNLSESEQYLVKNIENLADGILKEVDFENEFKAAKKLSKYTRQAKVVVPIEAKPGIYIMEKAPGISLDTLVKYYQYESSIKFNKFLLNKSESEKWDKQLGKAIDDLTKKMEQLKAKSPEFKDFNLSINEINSLLRKYIDVMTEQFTKIDKHGKTLHADIHPGNIFINLDALKSKRGKLFTLIDTGNTIDLTKEQAAASLKLTSFIKNGNVKDIAKYVMSGAIFPKELTQDDAIKLVEKDLKTIFFDSKVKINSMNVDELFLLTNNVLRKHNIIPNDSQLNLNKAKKSAFNSFVKLIRYFFDKKYADSYKMTKQKRVLQDIKETKDEASLISKYTFAHTAQETLNMLRMSPKEVINYFRNKNMIKTNSEDHLIYKLKQDMVMAQNKKGMSFDEDDI